MYSDTRKIGGFTLLEVLIVVAIIGVLAGVVFAGFSYARSKSRDAKRLSDLHEIELALTLYYDKYGTYPVGLPVCNPGLNQYNDIWCRDTVNNTIEAAEIPNWIPGLNEFLVNVPHNPKSPAMYWSYHYYSPSPNKYWLMAGLENASSLTCGGGASFIWFDGTSNTCAWGWGGGGYLHVKSVI